MTGQHRPKPPTPRQAPPRETPRRPQPHTTCTMNPEAPPNTPLQRPRPWTTRNGHAATARTKAQPVPQAPPHPGSKKAPQRPIRPRHPPRVTRPMLTQRRHQPQHPPNPPRRRPPQQLHSPRVIRMPSHQSNLVRTRQTTKLPDARHIHTRSPQPRRIRKHFPNPPSSDHDNPGPPPSHPPALTKTQTKFQNIFRFTGAHGAAMPCFHQGGWGWGCHPGPGAGRTGMPASPGRQARQSHPSSWCRRPGHRLAAGSHGHAAAPAHKHGPCAAGAAALWREAATLARIGHRLPTQATPRTQAHGGVHSGPHAPCRTIAPGTVSRRAPVARWMVCLGAGFAQLFTFTVQAPQFPHPSRPPDGPGATIPPHVRPRPWFAAQTAPHSHRPAPSTTTASQGLRMPWTTALAALHPPRTL